MENVPGMKAAKTAKGENALEIILQAFRDVGYRVDWRILNAFNYGVPQSRRRIFIFGQRNGKLPTFPLPTHFGEDEGK
jgi:DNA (cytosine-5)-methyltransferase 1